MARTFEHELQMDSTSMHHLVDQLVHEEIQKYMDIRELTDMTSVSEVFSDPDSTGMQHVKQRTTTTVSKRSQTSAGSTQKKEEQVYEEVDSSALHASDIIAITEEEKKIRGEVKGWCPWYIYLAGLIAAVVVGFILYLRGNRWFRFE